METTMLKDINGKKTDIASIVWDSKSTIERLHIYNCKRTVIPLESITEEIFNQLYDYGRLITKEITKEEFGEDYDWVKEIYKNEWKCTCGNVAYNYNVRELEAGEEPECPHCHRIIHTMDNRNWG